MSTFSDLEPGPTIYWPAGTSARWRLTIRQCKTCPALDLSGDGVEVEFVLKRSATASDATAKFTKKLSTGGIVAVDLALGIVDVIVDADDTVAADGVGSWFYTTRVTLEDGEILQPFGLSGVARLDLTVPTDVSVVAADSTSGTIDPVSLTPAPLPAYATIVYVDTAVTAEAATRAAADTANATAISTHTARVDNPHSVTKTQVGLGNVDDTSDAAKPVSILTQAALDLKANASGSNVSANAQAWRTAISAGLAGHGAFQNLRGILRRGRSASALIAADSTSNAPSEWFYKKLESIAAANPTLNVVHQEWDMTAQSYLAPTYIQTGSNGAGYIEFTSPPPATTTPPSLPATAAITGDFGGAVQITAADYTPAALQLILRLGNAGDNNVWWLALNTTGTLRVTYNTNAGASGDDQTATSTVALSGVTDGVTKIWVGFTYDRDNGSGGSDFKFYTSTDGLIWTQLGATVTKTTNNLIRTNGAANSWWLGGTGASFAFVGKIHAVRVLAGSPSLTTGVYQIPEEIAAWNIGNESYQAMGGGQTLWAYNASLSGQTLDYHTATAARTASICIHNRIPFVIFSSAHNYGTTAGATYRGYLDTARAAVATALPNATFAGSTQNPQISPRSLANQLAQEQRARDMVQWCRENGIGCVNGYEAFVGSGLDLSTLIDGSDGVHPNNAGSLVWRDAAFAEWNAS